MEHGYRLSTSDPSAVCGPPLPRDWCCLLAVSAPFLRADEAQTAWRKSTTRHAGPRVKPFLGFIDTPVAPPHRQCQRRPRQRLASGSGHPQRSQGPRPMGTWGSVQRLTDSAASRCSPSARTASSVANRDGPTSSQPSEPCVKRQIDQVLGVRQRLLCSRGALFLPPSVMAVASHAREAQPHRPLGSRSSVGNGDVGRGWEQGGSSKPVFDAWAEDPWTTALHHGVAGAPKGR
ncbi:hypothetical protein QBC39DRAFT_191 [Podospora conica]|nr:hypothetical protein QBC39DRAFT_191 [Schizothecium conicum]